MTPMSRSRAEANMTLSFHKQAPKSDRFELKGRIESPDVVPFDEDRCSGLNCQSESSLLEIP